MSFVVHRVAKSAARYTAAGGREKCAYCRFFVAPRACGKVISPVSPQGWCKYFSRQVAQQYSGAGITGGGGPPGATLSLDFMSSGNMPAGVTFTRASTATYTDSTGTIQTAAINQPRWDYAGGSLRGLLIEEARTNLLLNSATLGTQSVTVTAQSYTLSFYGTGTIIKSGAATGALVGTGAGQRVTQTFTPTAGTVTCTVTGSVLNAQIEAGSFVTSWVPSAGAAATRAADVCYVLTNAGWFDPNTVTLSVEVWLPVVTSAVVAGFGDNISFGNSFYLVQNAGAGTAIRAGGGAPASSSLAVGVNKIAGSNTATLARCCANGGAVGSVGQSASALAAVTGLAIGTTPWSMTVGQLNGHIRRVQYWPRVLSDTEMQQVTI